jgi:hypothetical protein
VVSIKVASVVVTLRPSRANGVSQHMVTNLNYK